MDLLRSASRFRYISILTMFQYALTVAVFCGVGVIMKFGGYPESPENGMWNPVALFIRTNLGLLMAIPLVWAALAIASEVKLDDDVARVVSISVVIFFGLGLSAAVAYSAIFPVFVTSRTVF